VNTRYDLIVIGSGPAGQRAAVQAAKLSKKVLIVEKDLLGGSCLHFGTIPSKTLRESVLSPANNSYDLLEQALLRTRSVIEAEMSVMKEQLRRNQIECVNGTASFRSPHCLDVSAADKPQSAN
jgi:NAD(P) transhydrogenase